MILIITYEYIQVQDHTSVYEIVINFDHLTGSAMTSRHAAWTSIKQAYVDGTVFCVEIAIVRLVTSI